MSIELTYEENVEDYRRLHRMLESIWRCPAPVVARIQGHALGGGAGLAACVDIGIAGDDAVFGFSEVRLGIMPAVISPMVLAKIGAARRGGISSRASASTRPSLFESASYRRSQPTSTLRSSGWSRNSSPAGPSAVREAKRLVLEPGEVEELLERAAAQRVSDEGQDGLRAFLERRSPTWDDRPRQ